MYNKIMKVIMKLMVISAVISPIIVMIIGFWAMDLTDWHISNPNDKIGIALVTIGLLGTYPWIKVIADVINGN